MFHVPINFEGARWYLLNLIVPYKFGHIFMQKTKTSLNKECLIPMMSKTKGTTGGRIFSRVQPFYE